MLILSRVCADFHDRAGKVLFTIYPHQRYSFLDAPESIREDPLFGMLLADGSLEAVRSVEQLRTLESDSLADTTAEGKRKTPETEPTADVPTAKAVSDGNRKAPEADFTADPIAQTASDTAAEGKKTRKASK